MKKVLFSVFAVAAVMTACSKSDVVDAPNIDTPITFEAYSGKVPVSKATSIDDQSSLSAEGGFVVYAYNTDPNDNDSYTPLWNNLYLNETLTLSDDGSWKFNVKDGNTVPNVHYWPSDGNPLAFVAYSNNGGATVVEPDENNSYAAPSLNVTIPSSVAGQKDVMVAKFVQTKSSSETSAVTLNFKHVLSRVYFELTADREIVVSSVKIKGGFYSSGTVALTSDNPSVAVEGQPDVEEYTYLTDNFTLTPATVGQATTKIIDNTLNTPETDDYYMMIIPGDLGTVEIEYSFTDDKTNSKYRAVATPSFDFVAGTSYKFSLVLASQEITFNVSNDGFGWNDGNTDANGDPIPVEFVVSKIS